MARLTAIFAANYRGVIGIDGKLPWRVPSDLRFFKATTFDSVVIMGRRTFESLGRKPLPGRRNVVLSHGGRFQPHDDLRTAASVEQAMAIAEEVAGRSEDIFVIGGAVTYAQFADYVDRYLVTLVAKEVPGADTMFDEAIIGDLDEWDIRALASPRQNDGDEAAFEIIEALRRDRSSAARRMTAISAYKAQFSDTAGRLRSAV